MKPISRNPEHLTGTVFDLLIIGGGITGAGCFRDAALRGLKVALIDKGDFACGTSSASSKLIHGGLRYLEQFQLGVVRQSLRERHTLLRIAPHMVRPLRFLIPIYKGFGRSRFMLRVGLSLYDGLAGKLGIGGHAMLPREEALRLRPGLRADGLVGAAAYYDAGMDDARLCLLNAMDGWGRGGIACNHVAAERIARREDLYRIEARDMLGAGQFEIRAKTILNATGPWSDGFLRNAIGLDTRRLMPSKGTHLVFSGQEGPDAILLFAPDGRIFFSIPWYGATVVGTTDTAFSDSPDNAKPSEKDREYLLDGISAYFGTRADWELRETGAFAGVRPLVSPKGANSGTDKPTYRASREELLSEDLPGFWSLAGGKYTTYRAMAEQAMDTVCRHLRKGKACQTGELPLPGGDISDLRAWESRMAERLGKSIPDPEVLGFVLRAYGTESEEFVRIHGGDQLGRIDPGVPVPRASIRHAREYEMAATEEDALRRRTPCALLGHGGDGINATGDSA